MWRLWSTRTLASLFGMWGVRIRYYSLNAVQINLTIDDAHTQMDCIEEITLNV